MTAINLVDCRNVVQVSVVYSRQDTERVLCRHDWLSLSTLYCENHIAGSVAQSLLFVQHFL
jgi:hypothetical protein